MVPHKRSIIGLAVLGAAGLVCNQAAAAPQAEQAGAKLEEVVVTAQRRSEAIRDVPISIVALSADMLTKAGVTGTIDLPRVAAGVEMPMYGGYLRPSIRGIVTGLSNLGDSSNVALYVDGVYQPSASGQLADLPDVESVQIVKGPQGTLYGQNAAGGAVIVDTIAPSFSPEGRLSASYGNYEDRVVRGYATGPLGSTVAGALSASYQDRDGYNRDLLRGGHDDGLRSHQVRGKLLWAPDEDLSLTLSGYYANRKDTSVYTGAPLRGNSVGNAIASFYPGTIIASQPHTFATNVQPDTRIESHGVSLLGKFGLGDIGTLNTVTAYQDVSVLNITDVDQSAINVGEVYLPIGMHAFIQEVNFVSDKFGALAVASGLFFMDRQETYDGQTFSAYIGNALPFPARPAPDIVFGSYSKNEKRSYAAYLDVSYDLSDTLTLTGAGRYSYEEQKVFNSAFPDASRYPDPRGSFHFSKFTPRAVLRWKPDEDNMFYASYSRGFKSGLVDNTGVAACGGGPADISCLSPPVKPETIDAYEIGYKARVSDTLTFGLAAFHYKYEDIQVYIYIPPTGVPQNAAAGRIDGVELEGSFRAATDLTFNLGVSYLDTEYTDFPAAAVYEPTSAVGCAASFLPFPCGNTQLSQSAAGNRLVHAPQWTANASIDYGRQLSAGRLGLNVSGNYDAGIFHDANNRIEQRPYTLLSGEVSFAPAALPDLRLVLWGRNLTDRNYLQSVLESPLGDAVSWAAPRTYGVRGEFSF
jgi:iron complex outermembrane recepter protein